MTKSKAEIASEVKFNFTIKEINRFSTQISDAIQNKNIELIEKIKAEFVNLESDLKNSYFGIAEGSIESF